MGKQNGMACCSLACGQSHDIVQGYAPKPEIRIKKSTTDSVITINQLYAAPSWVIGYFRLFLTCHHANNTKQVKGREEKEPQGISGCPIFF